MLNTRGRLRIPVGTVLTVLTILVSYSAAQTAHPSLTTLYSFGYSDGAVPEGPAPLIFGNEGALYGMTLNTEGFFSQNGTVSSSADAICRISQKINTRPVKTDSKSFK